MSELKTDNPAQRLLDLFEQENEYQITDNCQKSLAKIIKSQCSASESSFFDATSQLAESGKR